MQAGLLQTYRRRIKRRGFWAWSLSLMLFAFYIIIYFTDFLQPLAESLQIGSKWNIYGILYTLAIIVGGVYFLKRHGNSTYHRIRTISLMVVQTAFAFSLPYVMELFQMKGFTFSIFWPLKIDYFYPSYILEYPLPFILYAFLGSLLLVPLMTFFVGKRWYCSWICGCGGLAETAGDPFRHLSNKGSRAWRFEQITVHSVMLLAVLTTIFVLVSWAIGDVSPGFATVARKVRGFYAFVVVALLSGIFGVGLYPLLGSRVWCRFFCPLAAIMGLIQKFGRYRITVKDDMCISCGNCSTYCEMGIDVRMYAQNNRTFKRASCVGCGMCAHMCPRGVLKLENKWDLGPVEKSSRIRVFDF